MTRGLVSGKFFPLHRGHQLLIETALATVDDLTILVYDSNPSGTYTPMPVEKRLAWIRDLYPAVENILAIADPWTDDPLHDTPEYGQRYADQIAFLGKFDYVFTSEPGYEAWVQALGAQHIVADATRTLLPISGSQIRENVYDNRGWIDPSVYRTLIQKVAFVGSESTGKTTLAQALAGRYETRWVHEYARELWTLQRGGTFPDHLKMAENQYRREQAAVLHSRDFLFCDTNAWITKQWSLWSYGTVDARLDKLVADTSHEYVWFVCDNDIPWVQDEDRMRELLNGKAERFQDQIVDALDTDGIDYVVLSGSLEQRMDKVSSLLTTPFPVG